MPLFSSSRASSVQSHWDRERPTLSGISQASLTRCKATTGGKNGLAPASAFVLETGQAFFEEARHPTAHDFSAEADKLGGLR